jgi:hypothetical protein
MSSDDDLLFRSRGGSASTRSVPETRDPKPETRSEVRDSIWTLPLLCLGLSIIACCVLLPASDANRKLVLEREKLKRDLAAVEKQSEVNAMFLNRVSGDPELAERLAQRQMRFIREGTNVLELPQTTSTHAGDVMNPFLLTALPGAAPMAKLPPKPGILGKLTVDSRLQLYALGVAMLLLAIALVMGSGSPEAKAEAAPAMIKMVTYGDGDDTDD